MFVKGTSLPDYLQQQCKRPRTSHPALVRAGRPIGAHKLDGATPERVVLLEVEAERREEPRGVLLSRPAHKRREVVGEHERGRRVAADEVARVLEQRALRGRREVEEDRLG